MYANVSDYLGLNKVAKIDYPQPEYYIPEPKIIPVNTQVNTQVNTADPKVWGPHFWFTLHNSAAHYPEDASPLVRERMKGRILAIPYEIPCAVCRPHASAFVEKNRTSLDKIVGNKHELGKFYVDFHNQVNIRYNKPTWTYEQAYKYYSGGK